MIYELICKITPKQAYKTRINYNDITIRVEIYEHSGNKYGNGKELQIQVGNVLPEWFDIRYDIRYNNMSELEYVETFVKEYAHMYLIFEVGRILEVKTI